MNFAQFAIHWRYGIQRALQRNLESLRDNLASDDEQVRNLATDQAGAILDWLYPPLPPLSEQERLERVSAITGNEALSVEEKVAAIRRAARSTGRRRGRPRTDTAQHAIRALTLHLATSLSWREIALEIIGCKHPRPNPERSCVPCGEAIRNAAIRLEAFLISIGFDLPTRAAAELDERSLAELTEALHVQERPL
jgi:hypothetical protein